MLRVNGNESMSMGSVMQRRQAQEKHGSFMYKKPVEEKNKKTRRNRESPLGDEQQKIVATTCASGACLRQIGDSSVYCIRRVSDVGREREERTELG